MVSFHREIKISMSMNETLSNRRGFLFHVSAGFTSADGRIDPESGMLVSLVKVDQWLEELRQKLEKRIFPASRWQAEDTYSDLLKKARLFLQKKANEIGAELVSLDFREERGWGFYWDHQQSDRCLRIYQNHFLEILDQKIGTKLIRAEFHWARVSNCEADLHREAVSILKKMKVSNWASLIDAFTSHPHTELKSGTTLVKKRLGNPRDNEILDF